MDVEEHAAALRVRWVGKQVEARNPNGTVAIGALERVEVIGDCIFLFGEGNDVGYQFDYVHGTIKELGAYPPVLH